MTQAVLARGIGSLSSRSVHATALAHKVLLQVASPPRPPSSSQSSSAKVHLACGAPAGASRRKSVSSGVSRLLVHQRLRLPPHILPASSRHVVPEVCQIMKAGLKQLRCQVPSFRAALAILRLPERMRDCAPARRLWTVRRGCCGRAVLRVGSWDIGGERACPSGRDHSAQRVRASVWLTVVANFRAK